MLVVYAGFAGAQVPNSNFAVTFIYVVFWVGMPVASVLFGDIFKALSPWRSCARAIRWAGRRVAPKGFCARAAALSGLARHVAGGRSADRLRVA